MERPKSKSEKLADLRYEIQAGGGRLRDMPENILPREEAARVGIENVADDVLVALILRTGIAGCNVVELSRGLLVRYGSLSNLAQASVAELSRFKGIGKTKAQMLKAALELGLRLELENQSVKQKVKSPEDVVRILGPRARMHETEVLWTLLLDTKNNLQSRPVEVSAGLLNASLVHPREVFRDAIRSACAAVIVAHNHPSGDPSPSAEDISVTKQLVEAGRIIEIKVLDHIVIGKRGADGRDRFVSMREEGLVDFV